MITAPAIATVATHFVGFGWGFPWLFFLIPLFVFFFIVLICGIFGRRWRHYGYGPGRGGHPGWQNWQSQSAARSAESTLAERFAQGDIDEVEYRARLEVLRANSNPTPPTA